MLGKSLRFAGAFPVGYRAAAPGVGAHAAKSTVCCSAVPVLEIPSAGVPRTIDHGQIDPVGAFAEICHLAAGHTRAVSTERPIKTAVPGSGGGSTRLPAGTDRQSTLSY